jgi:predicted ATPase/DNA-binding SARP family transcriptional activator
MSFCVLAVRCESTVDGRGAVPSSLVEVRVLGPVELFDGTSVVRLPRVEQTLLAALAARVGERVPVDALEEALWPAGRPPSARKTLQGHIMRLRRALGPAAIVERDGGYRLDPELVEVDATRVTQVVAAAREALRRGDAEVAIGLLADVKDAFRGEPYEGVPDAAVPAGEVQRLVEVRVAVVEDAAEAQLDLGRGARCVAELEAFVQANSYRERAWGLLMRALYQAGRPADALAAFGRARVLLAAELGIEPGPALREVEQAILTHDPGLAPTAAASRRGLGRSNLPAAVSPIVGRQLELAVLVPLLLSERLVTLTGAGGIGKTRLAIDLAIQPRHELGPYFVDLAPIGDVELVPAALAAALGVQVEPDEDAMTVVAAVLDDHPVVILLDNCEHLLPGIADLVAGLVASSPGVRVVATSREALGVAGERVCPVDPLPVPSANASVDQVKESDAGALFVARLPINLATGPLSPEELEAIGAICRTLEGIPLGLELAAARCRTMSLPQLAGRLRSSIGDLAPFRHGVLPRHRTMHAALDWGFALLSSPAQAALRAMSVFAGGCDTDAFIAVCVDFDHPPADDALDELVRTSFVTVDFTAVPTRYRLLEPVRQYARELLDASEGIATASRRHLQWYLGAARKVTKDIDQLGFDTQWDDLRLELGNFRAALDWAATDADSTDAGLRLASRLWDLWSNAGHHDEGLSRIVGLLDSRSGSAHARSEAAYSAGFIAYNTIGDEAHGFSLFEQALAEAQAGGDRIGEARARRVLGPLVFALGDLTTARQHLETATSIAIAEGNDLLHSYCEIELAELLRLTGELDEAAQRLATMLDGLVDPGGRVEIPAHSTLAAILVERGDYTAARASAVVVVEVAETHSNVDFLIEGHLRLAVVEVAVGNAEQAAVHATIAEELNTNKAHGWDSELLQLRADIALLRSQHAEALRLAEQAVELDGDSAVVFNQCYSLAVLGNAQLAAGEPELALTTFQQLITRAGVGPYPCRQAAGYEGAAAADAALGRLEEAAEHLARATYIRRRTNSKRIPWPAAETHLARLAAQGIPDQATPERHVASTPRPVDNAYTVPRG